MKIYRNGVEIELTEKELYESGQEYDRLCDVMDIMAVMDWEDNEEAFRREYGIGYADLEKIKEECAERYREYVNDSHVWFDCCQDAIVAVVTERRLA